MGEPELILPSEHVRLDYNWVTDRLAVGSAIWTRSNMWRLANDRVTHVVDLQTSVDDSALAEGTGISVIWAPFPDDLQEKPPELFVPVIDFCLRAFQQSESRIYFHCAGGVHRSPMMLLAFLGALGMKLTEAVALISTARPATQFPPEYRRSVARFLADFRKSAGSEAASDTKHPRHRGGRIAAKKLMRND
jgi:protein-tyrosine phosphatase